MACFESRTLMLCTVLQMGPNETESSLLFELVSVSTDGSKVKVLMFGSLILCL